MVSKLTIGHNTLKLLVVAAWEPELTRLRERAERAGMAPGAALFREDLGMEIVLATLGVGLVEAAIGTTQCVARHRPTAALLVGTCGAFAPALRPGSVVAGARVRLVDAALVDGTAALPEPMPAAVAFDGDLHDVLVEAGATSAQIANTVGITTDDALASKLASFVSPGSRPADVEHLEAFGFARACAVAGLPCGALLGVANIVGSSGRAEWLADQTRASADAADLAWDALASIAVRLGVRRSTAER
jgi:nucleoside phosphorylase